MVEQVYYFIHSCSRLFIHSFIHSSLFYSAKDPVARKMRLRLRRQQSIQASAANKGEQDKQAAVLKVGMLG